ncbi:hypothetical protein OH492_14625 [Vibrio chagasii]|nr:hypothetical protein [Vibrio chagasii]
MRFAGITTIPVFLLVSSYIDERFFDNEEGERMVLDNTKGTTSAACLP